MRTSGTNLRNFVLVHPEIGRNADDFFDEFLTKWNICCGRPPSPRGHSTAAEIGLAKSKYQSCGKTSSSSPGADQGDSILVVSPIPPPAIVQSSPAVQSLFNQQQLQQQQIDEEEDECEIPTQVSQEVTSAATAVHEAPGADKTKTTINIGFAMNHVNDQENLKQLNLTPVQVNEVEEMDTQEGSFFRSFCFYLFFFSCFSFSTTRFQFNWSLCRGKLAILLLVLGFWDMLFIITIRLQDWYKIYPFPCASFFLLSVSYKFLKTERVYELKSKKRIWFNARIMKMKMCQFIQVWYAPFY